MKCAYVSVTVTRLSGFIEKFYVEKGAYFYASFHPYISNKIKLNPRWKTVNIKVIWSGLQLLLSMKWVTFVHKFCYTLSMMPWSMIRPDKW